QEVFDREPDVWAEIFRHGSELLSHPQMLHDRSVVTVADAERGALVQPGPMVHLSATPAVLERSAPTLDEHGATLRSSSRPPAPATSAPSPPTKPADDSPPLAGVTVIEMGTYYAAPYGAT